MPYHNCIDVIREQDKLLYRILKDLEREGESIVSSNNPEWRKVSSKIGHKDQLQDKGLLYPIFKPHQHNKNSDLRVVKTPKNVEVREEIRGKISKFPFKIKK